MSKVLILYATMSGNTERVAYHLLHEIPKIFPEVEITIANMIDATKDQLNDYELIIMGSSTWTDGTLNPIAEEFFDRLLEGETRFDNMNFAVFGLGESYYPEFCTVVEKTIGFLTSKGGTIIGEGLKLDGYFDENMQEAVNSWIPTTLDGFYSN